MSKKKQQLEHPEQTKEKVITKYDRKMEQRRKEAKQEQVNKRISQIVVTLILLAIVGTVGYFAVSHIIKQQHATKDVYLTIGDHELSQLEYEYYYNTASTNYINTNQYSLYYNGFDSSLPYDEQNYDENMTWEDYFQQLAITQMQQEYALQEDAEKNSFTYDSKEEYDKFLESAKTSATEANQSLSAYWKSLFGEYATRSNIKPFIDRSLYVSAYNDHLVENFKPSVEDATAYYEANKGDYDLLTYYTFYFDPSNYDKDDDLSAIADEMAEKAKKTDDFDSLCAEYAPESIKAQYEATDNEYSLSERTTATYADTTYKDWLLDESRKANDVTVAYDESVGFYYVVKFIKREYDENCIDTIQSNQAAEKLNTYLDELIGDNYEPKDVQGHISYLKIKQAQDDAASTSESLLNTDVIE